jgi:hypothetical protein
MRRRWVLAGTQVCRRKDVNGKVKGMLVGFVQVKVEVYKQRKPSDDRQLPRPKREMETIRDDKAKQSKDIAKRDEIRHLAARTVYPHKKVMQT